MNRLHHHDTPFAYGHRDAFRVLVAILRCGGNADAQSLTQSLQMPDGAVKAVCGMLAADGLVSASMDDGRMVYVSSGAQLSELLLQLSESYVWRAGCTPSSDQRQVASH